MRSRGPDLRLGGIAQGAKPTGEADLVGLLRGFAREPRTTVRAARNAMRALRALERVA